MSGSYDFEEQERIAELKAWWEDNRWFVIGGIAAALIAFALYRGWIYWSARQAEDAAAMFKPVAEETKKLLTEIYPLIRDSEAAFDQYAKQQAIATLAANGGHLDIGRTLAGLDQFRTAPFHERFHRLDFGMHDRDRIACGNRAARRAHAQRDTRRRHGEFQPAAPQIYFRGGGLLALTRSRTRREDFPGPGKVYDRASDELHLHLGAILRIDDVAVLNARALDEPVPAYSAQQADIPIEYRHDAHIGAVIPSHFNSASDGGDNSFSRWAIWNGSLKAFALAPKGQIPIVTVTETLDPETLGSLTSRYRSPR